MYSGLALYKCFAKCYDGAPDNDLSDYWHGNCVRNQQWIYLFDLMIKPFKGKGHIICDPTYIGNIMTHIPNNEWKLIMVGTI